MVSGRKIGIIGVGPRGGYALENFITELANKNSHSQIHLLLFEETGNFGNGQVYDLNQNKSNWINISERVLLLNKRERIKFGTLKISSFPSYHEWINKDFETVSKKLEDTYPPRAKVGKYLKLRFESLVQPLLEAKIVSLHTERVVEINMANNNKLFIKTNSKFYEDIDEVLLTIGHQPTELSQQVLEWEEFATNKFNVNLFKSPYPLNDFLLLKKFNKERTIGIRGFGLAMIDVMRAIAHKFGQFIITDENTKSCKYQPSNKTVDLLIPFSLDGLPPAPKPLNAEIDKWFEPAKEQLDKFEEKIGNPIIQKEASDPYFLISAFAPIAAKIYLNLTHTSNQGKYSEQEIEEVIIELLQENKYKHPTIIPHNQTAYKTMQDFVDMATGNKTTSLDYCIGQVWRHCQPSVYKELSFNECSAEIFAEIIELDESTKRYSYGPPVESIQQMLALVEAGVMNLDWVNNPDFKLTDKGWKFLLDSKSITADIMIDSVLDAPQIKSVNSPVVSHLLANDLIEAIHDDFGIKTGEDGYVISNNTFYNIPIALLGRLAKGTIIGVDAILECFGERPKKWAIEAANRHIDWLNKK